MRTSLAIENPAETAACRRHSEALASAAPRCLDDPEGRETEYWDISLAEVLAIALQNGETMKSAGVSVLAAPESVGTVFDPAITEADPLFGVEGSLSEFDTTLTKSLTYNYNDRTVNNITLGGGTRDIRQELTNFSVELSKTAATGTQFNLRNITILDASNQPGNLFGGAWDTIYEAEVRQPLLQGAGVDFNRIAGPNAQPGFFFSNGVLIARTNTDISTAEFETDVKDFVSEVEDAYWDLYLAYRTLDSWRMAREAARQTWVDIKAQRGLPGGTADREARARVQYFVLQNLVQDALSGRADAPGGVYRSERRLRRLMNLPHSDGLLLRPREEPIDNSIEYDWDFALSEALSRRPEIRRQKWTVKRDELLLEGSKNFTLPRLDIVGLSRARGFGPTLAGDGSAAQDVMDGGHQEWQVGAEMTIPIGFRQAHAGVRYAELQLMRDRAILRDQELQIANDLADAISEVSRAHAAIRTNYNRLEAARERLTAAQEVYEVDKVSIDLVLDGQQALAQAMNAYYASLVAHEIAIKNVSAEAGTLLSDRGIYMGEGPWSHCAQVSARELEDRQRETWAHCKENEPGFISSGRVSQFGAVLGFPADGSNDHPGTFTQPPPMPSSPEFDPPAAPPTPADPDFSDDVPDDEQPRAEHQGIDAIQFSQAVEDPFTPKW
ncbi:TolC family protein [Stratiformator vulcanicus]|uniref:TolC family protein n=1 Tax=Stratiformator vulcanicus TaxID=2527980 RepID=UPI002877D9DC|nr:TolC family protein [Stratiformator vulcanicus]